MQPLVFWPLLAPGEPEGQAVGARVHIPLKKKEAFGASAIVPPCAQLWWCELHIIKDLPPPLKNGKLKLLLLSLFCVFPVVCFSRTVYNTKGTRAHAQRELI